MSRLGKGGTEASFEGSRQAAMDYEGEQVRGVEERTTSKYHGKSQGRRTQKSSKGRKATGRGRR